jgi:hypothetical protein
MYTQRRLARIQLPTYAVYGLVFVHHTTAVVTGLPVQGVAAEITILDFCARTTLTQHFYNNNPFPVEATYVFPVDERAAVCAFQADIDGFGFIDSV